VKTCGQTSIIPVFLLSHLIHNQPVEYFTYTGKIDKRGCECGVTQWIVFTKTSEINREQVSITHICILYYIQITFYTQVRSILQTKSNKKSTTNY